MESIAQEVYEEEDDDHSSETVKPNEGNTVSEEAYQVSIRGLFYILSHVMSQTGH